MTIQLIYASTARKLMSAAELNALLTVSRANNQAAHITGMLLYHDGNFMQVLEGGEDAVMDTYDRIRKDTRHVDVHLIGVRTIEQHDFADWTMAFTNINELRANEMPDGYSEFLSQSFRHPALQQISYATTFLNSFKRNLLSR